MINLVTIRSYNDLEDAKANLKLTSIKELQSYISGVFEKLIYSSIINNTTYILNIRKKFFFLFSLILQKHTLFKMDALMDIWGVDYPEQRERFQVNYLFTSTVFGFSLILRLIVSVFESLPSISDLYASGQWLEREVYDMLGVWFEGNSDLRRILTDYGFNGFPLRKDFPVTGYYELRYDYEYKYITHTALELTQEIRNTNSELVWPQR